MTWHIASSSMGEIPYFVSKSPVKFQVSADCKIDSDLIWARLVNRCPQICLALSLFSFFYFYYRGINTRTNVIIHWGVATHVCVYKLVIDLNIALPCVRCLAINTYKSTSLSIGYLRLIHIQTSLVICNIFKCHLKIVGHYSSAIMFLLHTKWILVHCVIMTSTCMDLLPDTQNCGLRMRREFRERFPRRRLQRKPIVSDPSMHHGTCVSRTCRDACRGR